jgi:glycosyltransferase involved in cell wall biosynthesis
MLVCHIWQNFFPIESGGVERYILNLSDFLHQQDQSMNFILLTDKSAYVPISRSIQISRCQRINSLEVHRLGPNISSFLRSSSYKLLNRSPEFLDSMLTASLYREATKIKGMDKVDIFHLHGFWHPIYPNIALSLSQRFHRPLVVTLHGDSVDYNDPYSMPIRTPAALNIFRQADVITSYSAITLKVLQEFNLGKICRLIPNFVDIKLFKRPTVNKNDLANKFVMVSRLSRPKDPMTPIRAFAQVHKEIPETTLKIVGYGPLFEYANRLIQCLNLQEVVTMVGKKSDVREYLWNSDISLGTRGSYITTLEAWAAGLPVIAPGFGIMKEIISNGENGLLVPPGDINQLACAMIDLVKNKDLRTTIRANATQTLKKHDIKNVASSIVEIYKSLQ